jgi:hypothetical protein
MISEKLEQADNPAANISIQEKSAPAEQYTPEKLGDIDQAAANAFEGEIREFVRRDVAFLRRQQRSGTDTASPAEPVTDNLNVLLRRVAGASAEEIDRVIVELQSIREMLRSEGERIAREVGSYASLSHAAMTAMKVIGDSLGQWKSIPAANKYGPRAAG